MPNTPRRGSLHDKVRPYPAGFTGRPCPEYNGTETVRGFLACGRYWI